MSPLEQQLMLASGQLIPMSRASQLTPYSTEYLSLLARKGRIKAIKISRDWLTTENILRQYMQEQQVKHNKRLSQLEQNLEYGSKRSSRAGFAGLGVLMLLGLVIVSISTFLIYSATSPATHKKAQSAIIHSSSYFAKQTGSFAPAAADIMNDVKISLNQGNVIAQNKINLKKTGSAPTPRELAAQFIADLQAPYIEAARVVVNPLGEQKNQFIAFANSFTENLKAPYQAAWQVMRPALAEQEQQFFALSNIKNLYNVAAASNRITLVTHQLFSSGPRLSAAFGRDDTVKNLASNLWNGIVGDVGLLNQYANDNFDANNILVAVTEFKHIHSSTLTLPAPSLVGLAMANVRGPQGNGPQPSKEKSKFQPRGPQTQREGNFVALANQEISPATPQGQVLAAHTSTISIPKPPVINDAYINQLINKKLDAYTVFLASFNSSAQSGSIGSALGVVPIANGQIVAGPPIVTYFAPEPQQNFNGASLAGFTDLSSERFVTQAATVQNALTVSGSASVAGTFTAGDTTLGSLTVSGSANFNGTTTLGSLVVSSGTTTLPGLQITSITGSVQCLHADANGNITGTGSDCGAGGGGGSLAGGTNGYVARWIATSTLSTGVLIDNGAVAGVNATSSVTSFNVKGTGTLNPFQVTSSTGTSLLTVLANGNVGIGKSPTNKLDVEGAGNFSNGGDSIKIDPTNSNVDIFSSGHFGTRLSFGGTGTGALEVNDFGNTGNDTFRVNNSGIRINKIESGAVNGSNFSSLILSSSLWGIDTVNPAIDLQTYNTTGSNDTLSKLQIFNGDSGKIILQPNGLGYVGIGTTSPSQKLDIAGSSGEVSERLATNFASQSAIYFDDTTNGNNIALYRAGNSRDLRVYGYAAGADVLTVQSAGKVGIGTTSPIAQLSIEKVSTTRFEADAGLVVGNAGGMQLRVFADATNLFSAIQSTQTGVTQKNLSLNPDGGNVGIGTTTPNRLLSLYSVDADKSPGLDITSGSTNGRDYSIVSTAENSGLGAGKLSLYDEASSTSRLIIDATGNVGIGTINPSSKLDVYGNITSRVSAGPSANDIYLQSGYSGNAAGYLDILTDGGAANQKTHIASWPGDVSYFMAAGGNVGIGTITPTSTLYVQGAGSVNPFNVASSTGKSLFTVAANGAVFVSQGTPNVRTQIYENGIAFSRGNDGGFANAIEYDPTSNGGQMFFEYRSGIVLVANGTGVGNISSAGTILGTSAVYGFSADPTVSTVNATPDSANAALSSLGAATLAVGNGNAGNYSGTLIAGKVGIGTSTPGQALTVTGNAYVTGSETIAGSGLNVNNINLNGGVGNMSWYDLNLAGAGNTIHISSDGTSYFGGSSALGIGTTTPAFPLDVYGTMRATTIQGLNWKDGTGNDVMTTNGGNTTFASVVRFNAPGPYAVNMGPDNFLGYANNSELAVQPTAATSKAVVIKAFTGQSANLTEWQDSSGAVLNVVNASGNVGIGTTTPLAMLSIGSNANGGNVRIAKGWLCVDNNDSCTGASTAGTIYAANGTVSGGADVAENYPTTDTSLQAGTVVAANVGLPVFVSKATSTSPILGIISTKPGVLLGSNSDFTNASSVPVALAGRVPVKITNENGNIKIGDYITVSANFPGYAMKATAAGQVLGRALENFNSATHNDSGTILVFLQPIYYQPKVTDLLQNGQATSADQVWMQSLANLNMANASVFADIVVTGSVAIQKDLHVTGIIYAANLNVDNLVVNKKLCIGETCVNEEQLKAMLQLLNNSSTGSGSLPSSTPSSNESLGGEVAGDSTTTPSSNNDSSTITPPADPVPVDSSSDIQTPPPTPITPRGSDSNSTSTP